MYYIYGQKTIVMHRRHIRNVVTCHIYFILSCIVSLLCCGEIDNDPLIYLTKMKCSGAAIKRFCPVVCFSQQYGYSLSNC